MTDGLVEENGTFGRSHDDRLRSGLGFLGRKIDYCYASRFLSNIASLTLVEIFHTDASTAAGVTGLASLAILCDTKCVEHEERLRILPVGAVGIGVCDVLDLVIETDRHAYDLGVVGLCSNIGFLY